MVVLRQRLADVLQQSLLKIREAGRAAGKNMWMIGDGPTLVEQGYNFLCITEPTMYQQAQLTELNEAVKKGGDTSASRFQDLGGA